MSFRARILLLVLGVAVVPLALIGIWLTGATARSGEALLRARLDETLRADIRGVAERWVVYRSRLLDVTEGPILATLGSGPGAAEDTALAGARLEDALAGLPADVLALALQDAEGNVVARRDRFPEASPAAFGRPVRIPLAVRDRFSGEGRGTLLVSLATPALLGESAGGPAGVVVAAMDRPEGTYLTPTSFDPLLLERPRFSWQGDDWITRTADLREPELRLIAAAPVAPFVGPFREAARTGALLLLVTAGLGMVAAVVLTGRMTRSLEALAGAAESVGRGRLEPAEVPEGDDEIGRVAGAFNQMTRSLRETLATLADREALAAVGEFAAELAHEVRNPLTAIQLDLQQVEERLPAGSRERALQAKALATVGRLSRTVTGALETARSGRSPTGMVDVRIPLERALAAARPTFLEEGAALPELPAGPPRPVPADAEALEAAFLNVLLNAAQAVEAGGRVEVRLERREDEVRVVVDDDGPGIQPELRERVFEPLVSRRAGGTGLGLPVTRRIIEAHGGRVVVEDSPLGGASLVFVLPAPAEAGVATDRDGGSRAGVTERDGPRGRPGVASPPDVAQ